MPACDYLHEAGYVFASACWFVCLTLGLPKNLWGTFHELIGAVGLTVF